MAPAQSAFTLSGIALPEEEDPLGIWQLSQTTEAVSFSAAAETPEEPAWRIALPELPETAEHLLTDHLQALTLSEQDLGQAQQTLLALSTQEAVSFSATEPLAGPQAALLDAVEALKQPVSYDLKLQEDAETQKLYRQWQSFIEQVRRTLMHYARIETTLAAAPVGLTEVGWTGDFKTTWPAKTTGFSPHRQYHLQAVHLALGSRIALLRVVSIVSTGAAGLALKAAMPGAQVLLLPATWKFVRDVLKELRKSWPQIQSLI